MRRTVAIVMALVLLAVLTACVPASPPPKLIAPDTVAAHRQFGQPAVAAPAGMTYQPDVVVVGGGHNAVLGGSADGLSWQLDPNAPGMSDVQVGKVLWATSTVVGRVLKVTPGATSTSVVLAPVPLTDVIRDGTLKATDTPVSPQSIRLASTAGSDLELTTPPTGVPAITQTSLIRRAAGADSGPSNAKWAEPNWGTSGGLSSSISGWEASMNYAPNGVNMSLTRDQGLRVSLDFGLRWNSLSLSSDTDIRGGVITQSQTAMKGLQELTVGLTGGAASPAADNTRIRLEVPMTAEVPIDVGVPLVAQFRLTFFVATAFGGNNATIFASARWKLAGAIGEAGGKQLVPSFAVEKSLTQSIGGISLAPSGLVFGFGLRVLLGLGAPGVAAAGPYVKLAATVGVTNGSALGSPLVRCHAGTLDIQFGVGAAAELSVPLLDEVTKTLTRLAGHLYPQFDMKNGNKATIGMSIEKTRTIISASQTVPDVPLCSAG